MRETREDQRKYSDNENRLRLIVTPWRTTDSIFSKKWSIPLYICHRAHLKMMLLGPCQRGEFPNQPGISCRVKETTWQSAQAMSFMYCEYVLMCSCRSSCNSHMDNLYRVQSVLAMRNQTTLTEDSMYLASNYDYVLSLIPKILHLNNLL